MAVNENRPGSVTLIRPNLVGVMSDVLIQKDQLD